MITTTIKIVVGDQIKEFTIKTVKPICDKDILLAISETKEHIQKVVNYKSLVLNSK